MQIDDLLSNGMVRRWSLVDGQARCVEDALASADAGALPALKRNAAIQVMVGAVEAYEAAQAVIAHGEPDNGQPKQIPNPAAVRPEHAPDDWTAPLIANPDWALLPRSIEDHFGEVTRMVPEPRWLEYDAAGAIIAAATPTTLALARWRQGEPSEADTEAHATWEQAKATAQAALDIEAAKPLAHDPRPVTEEISRRQFAIGSVAKGFMTQGEALAFVNLGTLPAAVEAVIATLPEAQQFSARMALASNAFRRHHPATLQFLPLLGINSSDADDVWRIGGAVP